MTKKTKKYEDLLRDLEEITLPGWGKLYSGYTKEFMGRATVKEDWMIQVSPFSEKYRLVPGSVDAEDAFLMYPDVFLRNESEDVLELLKLQEEIIKN